MHAAGAGKLGLVFTKNTQARDSPPPCARALRRIGGLASASRGESVPPPPTGPADTRPSWALADAAPADQAHPPRRCAPPVSTPAPVPQPSMRSFLFLNPAVCPAPRKPPGKGLVTWPRTRLAPCAPLATRVQVWLLPCGQRLPWASNSSRSTTQRPTGMPPHTGPPAAGSATATQRSAARPGGHVHCLARG